MAATLAEDVLHELFFSACGNSNEIETVAKMAYILRRFASKCLSIKVELSTIEFLSQWYRQFQFTNDSLAAKKIKDFLEKCSLSDYPNFNDFSVTLFRNIVDQSILLEALVVSLPSKNLRISLIEYIYSQICIYDLLLLAGKSKFDLRFFSMLMLVKIQRIVSSQESEHSIKLQNVLDKMREQKYTSLEVIKSIVEEITVTMCESSLCFDRKQLCLYAGVDNTGQTKITVKMIEEYTARIRNADPEVKSVAVLLQRGSLATLQTAETVTTSATLPNTSSSTTAGQVSESNDIVGAVEAVRSSPPTSPATTVETDDIFCDQKVGSLKSTQPLMTVQMQQIQQQPSQQPRPTLHTPAVLPVVDSSASSLVTSSSVIAKSHSAPSSSSNKTNNSDSITNSNTNSNCIVAVNSNKPTVSSSRSNNATAKSRAITANSNSNVTVDVNKVASPYSRTSTLSWDEDDDICFSSEKPVPAKKLEPVATRPSRRQQQQHQQQQLQQKQQKQRNMTHDKQNQPSTYFTTAHSTHATQHSLAHALSSALQYKPSLHIVSNNASILVGDSGIPVAHCAATMAHQIDTCSDHSGEIGGDGSGGGAVNSVNPNNDAAPGLGAAPQEGNVVSPPSQQSTASTDDNHISNNNSDNSSSDCNSNSSSCDSSEYQDYRSSADLALICPQNNDITTTAATATAIGDSCECDDSALIKRLFSDCCTEEQGDEESGRDEEAIRESRESALCDWLSDVLDQNHSSDTAAAANNLFLSTTSVTAVGYSNNYGTNNGGSATSSAVVTPTFTATPGKDAANGGYSYFNSCFTTSYNNNSNSNGSTSVEKCREGEEISPAVRVGSNISSSGGGTRKLKRKLTGGR